MILKAFSIYDSAAASFLPPFYMATEGQAIRAFTDAVNDPNSQFYKHPKDYQLHQVGTFDDQTGQLKTENWRPVIAAQEVKKPDTQLHLPNLASVKS